MIFKANITLIHLLLDRHCRRRRSREVQLDQEILSGHLHLHLQEDYWGGLPGKGGDC